MPHIALNPTTGESLSSHAEIDNRTLGATIRATSRAAIEWQSTLFTERATLMRSVATLLRSRRESLAELMAREMGKPITEGRSEVDKCAWVSEFYADNTATFLADEIVATDAQLSYVAYRPLGVVFAIMPWNYPFWQVFRFAAPALMGGNGALLKHAPNVPGCALAIEALFRDAGFPQHLFRTLIISHPQATRVIRHRLVSAVTLTGSMRAGQAVAKVAGAELKKCVLELGGSDPYLVLADADLDLAVEACATSRLLNSGQSCIAAKRFIVVASQREAFERRLVERMRQAVMGDPLLPTTTLGPQARLDLRAALHRQVTESVNAGARLLLGGVIPTGPGAFYPATVLTDVAPGMPAYSEEVFGPVAAIIAVEDQAAAVRVANDSSYGLGAAVFTRDTAVGEVLARDQLAVGSAFVNTFVRSDPRLPFGGIKASGYGRELARHGLLEFQNAKTIYIR